MLDKLLKLNDIKDGNARVRLNISAGISDKALSPRRTISPPFYAL